MSIVVRPIGSQSVRRRMLVGADVVDMDVDYVDPWHPTNQGSGTFGVAEAIKAVTNPISDMLTSIFSAPTAAPPSTNPITAFVNSFGPAVEPADPWNKADGTFKSTPEGTKYVSGLVRDGMRYLPPATTTNYVPLVAAGAVIVWLLNRKG